MKRIFDLLVAGSFSIVVVVPVLVIAGIVKLTSSGPVIHWSKRIGRENRLFNMPKFRTMYVSAPDVATHLLHNPEQFITPIGKFLRKTSLDELPQLWSILKGNMSFVGPRPALYNQNDLITLRMHEGIEKLLPGLTGWAQIIARDNVTTKNKVELDKYYLSNQSLFLDMKILLITFFKAIKSSNVAH